MAPVEGFLEKLCEGSTRRVNIITEEVVKPSGTIRNDKDIEIINIEPGFGKGKEIYVKRGGDVFTIDEKQDTVCTRDGNDLIVEKTSSLTEALTDYTCHSITLDGRKLTVHINHVIHPNYQEIVPNEGMPIPGNPTMKGNLIIKFEISFPPSVENKHKETIKSIFGP